MKISLAIIAVALQTSEVLATSHFENGEVLVNPGLEVAKRQVQYTLPASCVDPYNRRGVRRTPEIYVEQTTAKTTLTVKPVEQGSAQTTLTVRPPSDYDYFDFCSSYLQPVHVTATKTVQLTSTATIIKSTITSITSTQTSYAFAPQTTVTRLCPIPAPATVNTTCALPGWGYATNNIYSSTNDALTCHQLCLQNARCQSFQVVTNTTDPAQSCNLYSVPSGGNNTIVGAASPYTFYDRDCQDFSPDGCNAPVLTRAPTLTLKPRAHEVRQDTYTPPLLVPVPSSSLSGVCNCILGSAVPTSGIETKTISALVVVTTTLTQTSTRVFGVTVTMASLGATATSYSSVQ